MYPCLQSTQYKTVERVVQTLKNLCCALDEVETQTITDAVKRLRHSVNLPRTHSPKVRSDSHCTPTGSRIPTKYYAVLNIT